MGAELGYARLLLCLRNHGGLGFRAGVTGHGDSLVGGQESRVAGQLFACYFFCYQHLHRPWEWVGGLSWDEMGLVVCLLNDGVESLEFHGSWVLALLSPGY